jgi:thiamine pyrophosphate-dependent acetolactate synthase large subunit-like protein
MGSGISSAIGLALGAPHRTVVCICGDGGMQMLGMEALVAIKHRLPIVFAVFNDGRYNMVYHGYKQTFGRERAWDAPFVDFARWASAIGMPALRITKPGDITPALFGALRDRGMPALLDVRHDASIRVRGAGRVEALQHMSMPASAADA